MITNDLFMLFDFASWCISCKLSMQIDNVGHGQYTARLQNVEIKYEKDSSKLYSTFGSDNTPDSALLDYVEKISGRYVVYKASSENRIEISIPEFTHRIAKTYP